MRLTKNVGRIIRKWSVLYYSVSFILLIYFILQQALVLLLVLQTHKGQFDNLIFHGFRIQLDNDAPKWLWGFWEFYVGIIFSALICSICVLLITRFFSKNPFKYLGFIKIKKSDLKWLLYFIPLYIILEIVVYLFDLHYEIDFQGVEGYEIWVIVGMGIAGPIFEEILFRGFLLTRANELISPKYHWVTLIIVTILFTIPHFQYTFEQLLIIFCLGLYFGYVKWKTGNLWIPIIIHCVNNTLVVYVMLYKLI